MIAWATRPAAGGIGVFVGTTRDSFKGKRVSKLQYESFVPMAKKVLNRIAWAVALRYDLEAIVIEHRIGDVPVCGTSVAVVCSSEHRREALEGTAAAIAAIKARLPVWKCEWYEGDDRVWKENCECAGPAVASTSTLQRLDGPSVHVESWLGPAREPCKENHGSGTPAAVGDLAGAGSRPSLPQ